MKLKLALATVAFCVLALGFCLHRDKPVDTLVRSVAFEPSKASETVSSAPKGEKPQRVRMVHSLDSGIASSSTDKTSTSP